MQEDLNQAMATLCTVKYNVEKYKRLMGNEEAGKAKILKMTLQAITANAKTGSQNQKEQTNTSTKNTTAK